MKVLLLSPSANTCRYKEVYGIAMKSFQGIDSDKIFGKVLRTTLIVLFALQLVSTVERQVFDFLGYMWAPIIGNFFQIIVVIIGIFGACNLCRSLIVVYATWSLLWLGWNIFVICLYLEVGILNRNRERYILTIGTEGRSWWVEHGIGCEVTNNTWEEEEEEEPMPVTQPEAYVVGCILQYYYVEVIHAAVQCLLSYYYVEVIHAAVQCLLSLMGFVASCVCIYSFMDEDEDAMSSVSDELEFVKMRYHMPTHVSHYRSSREDMAFDNINLTSDFPPSLPRSRNRGEREMPPSYDTSMRNIQAMAAANHYCVSERHSVRSKAGTRSKRSTQWQTDGGAGDSPAYSEPIRNLPWVQITPSTNLESYMMRHCP